MVSSKGRGHSSPKPAKQKRKRAAAPAPATESAQDFADKRRRQNRLSQQGHRKKQHAYMRIMESFVEAIKATSEAEDEQSRYTKLLKAHTDLIEENRRLRETIITVRRRLVNLADQVTCAESDANPITESDGASTTSETTPQGISTARLDTTSNPNACPSELAERARFPDKLPKAPVATMAPSYDNFEGLLDMNFDLDPILPIMESDYAVTTNSLLPGVVQPSPQAPNSARNVQHYGPSGQPFNRSTPLYQQPCLFPAPTEPHLTLSNATIFAQQVVNAARRFAVQPSNWTATELTKSAETDALIEGIASTAVEVIGERAGLASYIYPIKFSTYMEYIMRWRISQTREDMLAIPKPFRPTPLQCNTVNCPVVVDFINWPSIRDQMIMRSRFLDLDAMCRDIVMNTVVDLPQFRIAVNIHDLLFNYVLPRTEGVQVVSGKESMLHDPSWVYLQVDPSQPGAGDNPEAISTEQMLLREIAARMSSKSSANSNGTTFLSANARGSLQGLSQVSEWSLETQLSSFRVLDMPQWKLSRDFARQYPYMDCSSVVSKFETIPCDSEQFRRKIAG